MATKSAKTVKSKNMDRVFVPDLHPRDTDVKYTGTEPIFHTQPSSETRKLAIITSLGWYSRYYDRKMAREQLANYAEYTDRRQLARDIRHCSDLSLKNYSWAWMARLAMRGLELTELEQQAIETEIAHVITHVKHTDIVLPLQTQTKSNRPSVQDIMRDRAREAAGELEGQFDDFLFDGAKTSKIAVNPVSVLTERNILPQHISMLIEVWTKKLVEFQGVLDETDQQLVEGYSNRGRNELKAMIKFCEQVIAGLESYISVKRSQKSVRRRKPVSPERQASKMKYLKTFEELKLTSVHPSKIVGASEVWCYDTARRKLHYYVADSHVGTLSIKGTTILGYDTSRSGVKTLRKPQDIIKRLMNAGKPAARKLFAELTTTHAQPNGRTNDNLVILRAY